MQILFATDLSEPRVVTDQVQQLARRLQADLLVLHVVAEAASSTVTSIDPMTGLSGYAPYALYDPMLDENIARAEENAFEAFMVDRFDRPVRAAIDEGDPAQVILEHAAEHRADLIILAKHHHSRLERLLLGSVTQAVLDRSPLPTLVIPIPEDDA